METKNYKRISNLIGFLLGIVLFKEILDYPFLLKNMSDHPANIYIPQGAYVIGLMCLIAFYMTILQNIKKRGVFIRKNEAAFRLYGFAILIMGLSADILFNIIIGDSPSGARMLAVIGGTLMFVSYIFKIGIKMQEEQELTI